MTRQERRKQERQKLISKVMTGKTLVSLGFFYKGAGITINDEQEVKEHLKAFEDASPLYQQAINKDGQSEIDFYFNQLDAIEPLLGKGLTISHQDSTIFMMNIYVLTKLGHIIDDNMNGLQYMYKG